MLYMLELAAQASRPDVDNTRRAYVGAVARRPDGAIVRARNGSAKSPSPSCHAEARLIKRCGAGSEVFVARVTKAGEYAMARPCSRCMAALRARGIRIVTFTTGSDSYKTEQIGFGRG